jgi:hypothetical protein
MEDGAEMWAWACLVLLKYYGKQNKSSRVIQPFTPWGDDTYQERRFGKPAGGDSSGIYVSEGAREGSFSIHTSRYRRAQLHRFRLFVCAARARDGGWKREEKHLIHFAILADVQ